MSVQLIGVILLVAAAVLVVAGVYMQKRYFPDFNKPQRFPIHSVFTWRTLLYGVLSLAWFGSVAGLTITGLVLLATP